MNITSLLGEIALNPVDVSGKATTPITYDSNCLEEICGLLRHAHQRQGMMACSALVDRLLGAVEHGQKPDLNKSITLAPLSKFPVVRDLAVDRSVLFENLKKVKAWVPIDGSYESGELAPARLPKFKNSATALQLHLLHHLHGGLPPVQRCNELRRSSHHRPGPSLQHGPQRRSPQGERLRALAGDGGIQECGFAQNCVQGLPQGAYHSPRPSATWAAMSSSSRSKTSSPASKFH